MVEHVLSKMEQQHVPAYLDTMDQFANKVDDILLLRARPLSSGVTIHIPCDSIQFWLLPFDFGYVDSIMQNINGF